MKTKQRARPSNERKVYRPSAGLRVVTTIVALLLLAGAVWFAFISTRSWVSTTFCALPIGLFFVLVLTYLSYTARRTSLVLTPHGIEYHNPNLALRTSWSNVERIVEDALAPRLLLREPVLVERSAGAGRRGPTGQAVGQVIPLRLFGYSRQSALGQDLRRFAPFLFASTERSPSV